MTPEAQNAAIAAACGKRYHKPNEDEIRSRSYYQYEPSYTTDLNYMHEAEMMLTPAQHEEFRLHLASWAAQQPDGLRAYCSAPASQRAEALLRALGKYET